MFYEELVRLHRLKVQLPALFKKRGSLEQTVLQSKGQSANVYS